MIHEVENAVHDVRCMDNYSTCCCISAGFYTGSSQESFRRVATTQICFFQDVFSLVKLICGFLGDAKGRTN